MEINLMLFRACVGKPIEYDGRKSVDEVVKSAREGLQNLIKENQRLPESVFRALLDRFSKSKKI